MKNLAFTLIILLLSLNSFADDCEVGITYLGEQSSTADDSCAAMCGVHQNHLVTDYSSVRGLFPNHTEEQNGGHAYCRCTPKKSCISASINVFSAGDTAQFPHRYNAEMPGDVCNESIGSLSECYKSFSQGCGPGCSLLHTCGKINANGRTVCGTISSYPSGPNTSVIFNESMKGQFVCALESKNLLNKEALTYNGSTLGGPGTAGIKNSPLRNLEIEIYNQTNGQSYGRKTFTEAKKNGDRAGWVFKLSTEASRSLKAPGIVPACRLHLGPLEFNAQSSCQCPKKFISYMKRYQSSSSLYTKDELQMNQVCHLCNSGKFPSELTKQLEADLRAQSLTSPIAQCLEEAEDEVISTSADMYGGSSSYSAGTKPVLSSTGEIKTAIYEHDYTIAQIDQKIAEFEAEKAQMIGIRDGTSDIIGSFYQIAKVLHNAIARKKSFDRLLSDILLYATPQSKGVRNWIRKGRVSDPGLSDQEADSIQTTIEGLCSGGASCTTTNDIAAKLHILNGNVQEFISSLAKNSPLANAIVQNGLFNSGSEPTQASAYEILKTRVYGGSIFVKIRDIERGIAQVNRFKAYLTCGTFASEFETGSKFDQMMKSFNIVNKPWPVRDYKITDEEKREKNYLLAVEKYQAFALIEKRRALVDVQGELDAVMEAAISTTLTNVAIGLIASPYHILTAARFLSKYKIAFQAVNGFRFKPSVQVVEAAVQNASLARLEKIMRFGGGLALASLPITIAGAVQICLQDEDEDSIRNQCLERVGDLILPIAVGIGLAKFSVAKPLPVIARAPSSSMNNVLVKFDTEIGASLNQGSTSFINTIQNEFRTQLLASGQASGFSEVDKTRLLNRILTHLSEKGIASEVANNELIILKNGTHELNKMAATADRLVPDLKIGLSFDDLVGFLKGSSTVGGYLNVGGRKLFLGLGAMLGEGRTLISIHERLHLTVEYALRKGIDRFDGVRATLLRDTNSGSGIFNSRFAYSGAASLDEITARVLELLNVVMRYRQKMAQVKLANVNGNLTSSERIAFLNEISRLESEIAQFHYYVLKPIVNNTGIIRNPDAVDYSSGGSTYEVLKIVATRPEHNAVIHLPIVRQNEIAMLKAGECNKVRELVAARLDGLKTPVNNFETKLNDLASSVAINDIDAAANRSMDLLDQWKSMVQAYSR